MTIVVETQGNLCKVKVRQEFLAEQSGGGVRGKVKGFSAASRRRMLDTLNRLATKGVDVKFVTLTFSGTPSPDEATKAFRRLQARLLRRSPNMSMVWRKEYQQRGSIHYHLLTFNMPYYPQRQLQAVWEECTGEAKSIVDIRKVFGVAQLFAYVSKYLSKQTDPEGGAYLEVVAYLHADVTESTGRHWGVVNRKWLPMGEKLQLRAELSDSGRYLIWTLNALGRRRSGGRNKGTTYWGEEAAELHWRAVLCLVEAEARPTWDMERAVAELSARLEVRQRQLFA